MKTTELRIGNWLKRLDDSEFQIDYHDFIEIATWTANERLLPRDIPLTEEWLLKFGFRVWGEFLRINFPDSRMEFLVLRNDPKKIRLKESDVTFELSRIEYVHQLQNLYSDLTGEELTICK